MNSQYLAKPFSNKVGAFLKVLVNLSKSTIQLFQSLDQAIQKQKWVELLDPLGGGRKHLLGPRWVPDVLWTQKAQQGVGIWYSRMQSNHFPVDFQEVLQWLLILDPRLLDLEQWSIPGRDTTYKNLIIFNLAICFAITWLACKHIGYYLRWMADSWGNKTITRVTGYITRPRGGVVFLEQTPCVITCQACRRYLSVSEMGLSPSRRWFSLSGRKASTLICFPGVVPKISCGGLCLKIQLDF